MLDRRIGDVKRLETVQRNFSKWIRRLAQPPYRERLQILGLDSLGSSQALVMISPSSAKSSLAWLITTLSISWRQTLLATAVACQICSKLQIYSSPIDELYELFQIVGYLIRIILDRERHAVFLNEGMSMKVRILDIFPSITTCRIYPAHARYKKTGRRRASFFGKRTYRRPLWYNFFIIITLYCMIICQFLRYGKSHLFLVLKEILKST